MYFSLIGSSSGSADTPPAAATTSTAAAAAAVPVTATAVSTKHRPQIPQSQRQAAKSTGTVNMFCRSQTLTCINSPLSDSSVI